MSESQLVQDFSRLNESVKAALATFNADQTPENFARIISALSQYGISGADAWREFASYTRRHPLRIAITAGLLFFAAKGILQDGTVTTGKKGSYH